MADRRPLTAGLKQGGEIDPELAKEFIYGKKPAQGKPPAAPAAEAHDPMPQSPVNRVHFTTRMRGDFAAIIKRASLERQLAGQVPNTIQDILEEAVEPWLRSHGYIQ
jgi:hypothetical protein